MSNRGQTEGLRVLDDFVCEAIHAPDVPQSPLNKRGQNEGVRVIAERRSLRYAVVIEKGPKSYGAYVPDLPGCVAVAKSAAEVKKLIAEAIALHLSGLREDGLPIPEPETECEYVEV